ncbi:ethanolamine permease [Streptomyces clavuligerus]|uniref:Ethanolamine transporter n=1 Tax=Streptomyces clavuligerus TaxID=1901 RepID=E2PW80_STRCL|nr:ethanolamine permease [Streptomyces clavuligerus]ANW21016.1 ethanolamine permease [Streptomyces clavuligerus]AXU15633.1 ethanolamine permease [Streptomyces clavuligerus]EFG05913.1 Ethanolamine transporter [Streptomyces clavuligerus]QCS08412.1 ethanolamine permease [Streptomyces clavuligerus]QPJ92251.1 ethanolamine permease [Streptomyces clavuligerus]
MAEGTTSPPPAPSPDPAPSSLSPSPSRHPGDDYLQRRALRRGSAGWLLLTGLGVAYVVSGDFSGWNTGLAKGGFGGLAIATLLMGVMYACLVFALAELSAILPTAGGGYGFARRALGPLGGFLTGTAILIEYILAPAAISIFIGDYVESLGLFGLESGWPVYLACFAVFIGIHLWGVGEALRFSLVVTVIAVAALLVFAVGAFTEFDAGRLNDIPADPDAFGSGSWLPYGLLGIWAAFPFGMWFFLGVEGVPLAAEEAKDPVRSLPRALAVSLGILALLALITFLAATGAAGSAALKDVGDPLVQALQPDGEPTALSRIVNYAGLAGLVASFFSLIYAGSRQLFALSRAGYLPRFLSLTSSRRSPYLGLLIPGAIGFALAASTGDGPRMLNIAVFGATISYALMALSHLVLRRREPGLHRPYRTPGGAATSAVALVLALAALVATFLVDRQAALIALAVYAVAIVYFATYSRFRLVAQAPEEEFAALAAAEAELERK